MSSEDNLKRRSFLKAAGGAAVAASMAGCIAGNDEGDGGGNGDGNGNGGGNGGSGGTLLYSRGSHSGTLDPQNTTSGEDVKVTNQMYDQLVMFEPGKTSLMKGLATEWDLSGTTATLTLREGVTFHNGEEFTASDFKATYRRFVDTEYEHFPGSDYASAYGPFTLGNWIKSVNAEEDYKLTIELKEKYAPFLRNLAMFASSVHSEKAIQEKGTDLSSDPVGTGPFQLKALEDSTETVRLEAFDDYWGDGPKVDEAVFLTTKQNTARAQSLDAGETHIVDGLGSEAAKIVDSSSNASLEQFEGINIGYMAFNFAKREEFRNKKVRQAISYAIDTKAIVDNIYEGFAEQANQPIPSNVLGFNDEISEYKYDQEKAQSLLDEAGYGDGFTFELATFKNPRGYNPSPISTAEKVRSDLGAIGITVEINQQSFDPFLDYTAEGKHDACFLGWYTDNGDPDNFFYALLHPGVESPDGQDYVTFDTEGFNTLNVAGWANQEYMTLVEEGQATYDEATRTEKYNQAAQLAHDEAPWVFIDHAQELRGVANGVSGYTPTAIGGPYLKDVTLSQ
ncbi:MULTISPECIES: ABC transporter substrate-binding protein [unclassified Haladaptatus]|uniref:ABC transporter substrate-binding protein n=1 Tax=unclassified Haladaptatus TaxID=2622732 RepID=UPI0023E7584E|nr:MULTISPECIES: ABC transporter substrate-binding protein [unclassified Haladaptatus]